MTQQEQGKDQKEKNVTINQEDKSMTTQQG